MEHSSNYEKVRGYYSMKLWTETRVRNAVKMGWIKIGRASCRERVCMVV